MLQTRRDTAQEYPITSSIVSTMPKYTDEERIEKIKYAKYQQWMDNKSNNCNYTN